MFSEGFFFFSKLFYEEPDEDFIAIVIQSSKDGSWFFNESNQIVIDHLKTLSKININLDDSILADYYRLFMGPEEILAKPYASLYIDKEGELFSEETKKVQQFYKNCGMVFENELKEPADHIGPELMFLGGLMQLASSAIKEDKKKELISIQKQLSSFVEIHLLPWVFDFLNNVHTYASSDFYKSTSILCSDFISCLQQKLDLKK